MLSENQYEMLGDRIAALYQELERDVIADIARRVKKTGRFTETAELMAKAMMETGKSPAQIRKEVMKLLRADPAYRKEVANNTKQYKRDAIHAIRQTEKEAAKMGQVLVAEAGDMSYNKDLWMWHQAGKTLTKGSAFTHIVEAMAEQTAGELKNLTKTTGFKGVHGYVSIQNAYTNALDKALIKMSSGAFSFDRAAEDCVRELAHSGLRRIEYASGRSYNLDTAARMCLRTGSAQVSARISMHNCDKTGTDLVEVDAHWGARPEHAEWQGKVYSRSGKHPKYPDFSVCRYGEVDGLCGVNCRHTFYPFFEGISEPNEWPDEPVPKEYNGKTYDYYAATQKQRKMEREIRATKREIEAVKSFKGDTDELEAKKRKQIREYHNFSNAMKISPKDNRLRVVRGSSDMTKTKAYENYSLGKKNRGVKRIPRFPASTVSEKIKNGEYSTKLSLQQFEKHRKGSKQYDDYFKSRQSREQTPQSILTISFKEAQKIIESKAGTGIIKADRKGNPKPQEQVSCDKVIGKYYYKGKYIDTHKATIHYGKKSSHIVPDRGENYD